MPLAKLLRPRDKLAASGQFSLVELLVSSSYRLSYEKETETESEKDKEKNNKKQAA